MKELVVAYSSLTVYYDPFIIRKKYQPATIVSHWVNEKLQEAFRQSSIQESNSAKIHRIPVCYEEEFGIDLVQMTTRKKISIEKIIEWHTSKLYRVYMLGFMPGFPYMGEVEEQLATPRKQKPVIVEAGSVGIAGTQTGIYPFKSPGGWNIIGRTPVSLFNRNEQPCVWLQPGDQVQFYSISRAEFEM
jgi:inhibitor of KinA